jgi:DNA-binding GntR family transcriptional regulator
MPNHKAAAGLMPLSRPIPSLASRSGDALREKILSGELAPGERLNEVELAAALQTSRAPLREAIQRLLSEGLLIAVSSKGAYVKTFSAADLREMYELRAVLETHAVRVGAQRADDAALDALKTVLDDTETTLDTQSPYPSDRDFHEGLVRLAGNEHLTSAARRVHDQIQLARLRSGHSPERAAAALREHREVMNSLLERDGDRTAALLGQHLDQSLANVLVLFDAIPESAKPGASTR